MRFAVSVGRGIKLGIDGFFLLLVGVLEEGNVQIQGQSGINEHKSDVFIPLYFEDIVG